jgi:hypothetical protein
MLTVLPAIRTARPFGQSVAVGLRHADPATLIAVLPHSRATGHLYISAGLSPAAVVSLETFVPEHCGQDLSSTLRFSALPVAATPCGSRYSLGTTQVRGTYAAEAVLLGVGPRRLATVGQRFLFSPSNRVDHFALRLFRSLRFHLPDIVRVLSPAPCRCRHWADAVTRTCDQLSLPHASSRPATLRSSPSPRDEGVSVTQCCNLFQSLNAALSNCAHSSTLTAAT